MSPEQRQRQRFDSRGKPIKTQGDYARMITTAIVLSILLVALFAGAYWLNGQYHLSQQVKLPGVFGKLFTPPVMDNVVCPLSLAVAVFSLLQGVVAAVISRFYRNPKDELDEYGMYKSRDR
jgi:ABC-type Fe3+ transport system permease subunit